MYVEDETGVDGIPDRYLLKASGAVHPFKCHLSYSMSSARTKKHLASVTPLFSSPFCSGTTARGQSACRRIHTQVKLTERSPGIIAVGRRTPLVTGRCIDTAGGRVNLALLPIISVEREGHS